MALGDLFIAVYDGNYYLVTSRGLVWLQHPDAINGMKAAGCQQVTYDKASFDNLKRVFSDAP